MHYLATNVLKVGMLWFVCLIVAYVAIEVIAKKLSGGKRANLAGFQNHTMAKTVIGAVLGTALTIGVNEVHAIVNPHHLQFGDVIEYYDPYERDVTARSHYIPVNPTYCTKEGDRITEEDAWRLFYETRDLERDSEGNVIATYPKGSGPVPDRNEDSPYYVCNMSEEQADAYREAKGIVTSRTTISKAKVYSKLTEANGGYGHAPEIASFALDALVENGIADWSSNCVEAALNHRAVMPSQSAEDLYKQLTEEELYTEEEARAAVEYAFQNRD